MKNTLQIRKDQGSGQRRLWVTDGITIRLLTKEAMQKMSDHGFMAYRKKFLQLRDAAGLEKDLRWRDAILLERLEGTDEAAFKAFDYLRHTIVREKTRRDLEKRGEE